MAAATPGCRYRKLKSGDGQVRAIIIDPEDEEQLLSNFEKRESTVQPLRAQVSWLYGRRLKQQGKASNRIVISYHPWRTLFEWVLHAVTQKFRRSIQAKLKDRVVP